MILDILGDTINLVLGLMDLNLGISARNGVYFTILLLFFEDWSFPDTNCELLQGRVTLF